ncbi:hypothetical protein [Helicobacter sp.]|uniref:hypothetical protein n=1 Tax=Helicobacter sp. TaxID=218 RepID=UPI0037537826|nr:hypothetical protein [Helicobacter sp.]MDD7345795.1 hypothetical protein [Helicobacter sp.]
MRPFSIFPISHYHSIFGLSLDCQLWIALFGDRACGDRILRKSATIESVLRKSVAISLALFVGGWWW